MPETVPSRTASGGVRYLFIDFGISSLGEEKVLGFAGIVKAPELSEMYPYDPFKVDVYILGKMYERLFAEVKPFSLQCKCSVF